MPEDIEQEQGRLASGETHPPPPSAECAETSVALKLCNITRLSWEERQLLLDQIKKHVHDGRMVRERVPASALDTLAQVQERVRREIKGLGYSDMNVLRASLIVEELAVDAAKHGSNFRPDREVRITYGHDGDHFGVLIADDGNGFDIHAIPDPTSPSNLEKESGRGILLTDEFIGPDYLGGAVHYLPIAPDSVLCNQVYVKLRTQDTVVHPVATAD